jgi:hypothetical protein
VAEPEPERGQLRALIFRDQIFSKTRTKFTRKTYLVIPASPIVEDSWLISSTRKSRYRMSCRLPIAFLLTDLTSHVSVCAELTLDSIGGL